MVICCVLALLIFICYASAANNQWTRTQCGKANLITQWGEQVDPHNVLPEYPRPQLVRPNNTWQNLNGLWEFQFGSSSDSIPFGRTLRSNILVPFPAESCLSGVGSNHPYLWYRLVFNLSSNFTNNKTLLNFGAVDWQCSVWVNTNWVGNHTGGYDHFSFDITTFVQDTNNELIIFVFDPSDNGPQPSGKQYILAIDNPQGLNRFTPSSGIWQTVWLENVPSIYISNLRILADNQTLTITTFTTPDNTGPLHGFDNSGQDLPGMPITLPTNSHWGCYQRCQNDSQCVAWSYRIPLCDGGAMESFCWLKGTVGKSVESYCKISGIRLPSIPVSYTVNYGSDIVVTESGESGVAMTILIPNPKLWTPTDPFLYTITVSISTESIQSYFGMRSISLRYDSHLSTLIPQLNGRDMFYTGWLDHSNWPDGQYTAPTNEALAFDVQAAKTFGLNSVRLHQKVNPERWYWYSDSLGIAVMQDMVQKIGGIDSTVPFFIVDLYRTIDNVFNHPSIIQWEIFNSADCISVFNATQVAQIVIDLDPSRLIDFNPGGPWNIRGFGDVNSVQSYPDPTAPSPSSTQYGMIGYGAIGAYVSGKEWLPNACWSYMNVNTPQEAADAYIDMANNIATMQGVVSVSMYIQMTDVETECDGLLNYDRTNKFDDSQTKCIFYSNQALTNSSTKNLICSGKKLPSKLVYILSSCVLVILLLAIVIAFRFCRQQSNTEPQITTPLLQSSSPGNNMPYSGNFQSTVKILDNTTLSGETHLINYFEESQQVYRDIEGREGAEEGGRVGVEGSEVQGQTVQQLLSNQINAEAATYNGMDFDNTETSEKILDSGI